MTKKDSRIINIITLVLGFSILLLPIIFKIVSLYNQPLLDPRSTKWQPSAWIIEPYIEIIEVKEVKAEEPIINNGIDKEKFFDTIWSHESTRGKNNNPRALHIYCRSIGKWNEIGYNSQKKHCFSSKEEATNFVNGYINRNCSGRSTAECLCRWNTGKFTTSCAYASGDLANAN